MTDHCDVIVLGMGTCGEDAALRLARSGLDIIGVEGRLIGGECPYYACLPTKSMVRSAALVKEAQRADGLVGRVTVEPDWNIIADRIRAEITGGWDDSAGVARFESLGGRFVRGYGEITAPGTVEVDGRALEARRGIVVATGSSPLIPPINGLSEVDFWTNREAIAAERLPARLAILGGGPVGVEMGQVFARFGVEVTIVEGADRILPAEEPEISKVVADGLRDDGVVILTGEFASDVADVEGGIQLRVGRTKITCDRLLVAVGRKADGRLIGADLAGATVDERGLIAVDDRLRAAPGLWAIGDVTGKGMLTQVALYQGMIAVEAVLGGDPSPADYSAIPRAIFTDPEVGSIGMTEEQARADGHEVRVVTKRLEATFRGWLHRIGNAGILKLVADSNEGWLLGASFAGPHGADVLGMLQLAVHHRTPLADLVNMIYAFPTFYGAIGEALGSYGRGVVRVMDPATTPMFEDPSPDRGN